MSTFPISPSDPTADHTRLDEMRRAMRRQALEHLAEADQLDALYTAVTVNTRAAEEGSEVTE